MINVATEKNIETLRQVAMLLERENSRLHTRLQELSEKLAHAEGKDPEECLIEARNEGQTLRLRPSLDSLSEIKNWLGACPVISESAKEELGIINAFADSSYRGSNQVVIVHELMHTLGATDKYGDGNLPAFPEGYAEPYRVPLYPQRAAEIMGGRIPLSQNQARIPESLREVIIGIHTAAEIHWPIP